ncbi:MAG: efflux RND transporter periplasmic adaptor subunit [Planctomycetia bacterium]|nr:efflux RND transporter periplasmic adaptor subunit [Planctomycetia bacterium]
MNPPPVPAFGPTLDAWDVIDQSIDELAQLAREPIAAPTFYTEFLRRTIEALAARRGTVWEHESAWAVTKTALSEFEQATLPVTAEILQSRADLVAWAATRNEPSCLLPDSAAGNDDSLVNPTDAVLLLCPWMIDGVTRGVLEIELRAATSPEARQGALRLLTTFTQIAADYERNRQRGVWKDQADASQELEAVLASIYADTDLRATAYTIANEGRRWTGCDRVAILRFDGKRSQTLAISGVDTIDRRADGVQSLERLATHVAMSRTDLQPDNSSTSQLPQIERALAEHIEIAEAREVVVLLLRESGDSSAKDGSPHGTESLDQDARVVGALVCERFTGSSPSEVAWVRMSILQRHAGPAIAHAAEFERIPLSRFWRRLSRKHTERRRRWAKIGIGFALTTIAFAIPFFIPSPFTVEARGTLEPRDRRELFAPASGIVREVLVEHGQKVAQGDLLVALRKPELEVELARLLGEMQTAERRLSALRANRTTALPADAAARRHQQELLAEEEQLQVRLSSLRQEQALLVAQEKELQVLAPTDGNITTWDVRRLLNGKPVDRGQPLLSIAELSGPWVLELRIPDRHFAEVSQARKALGERLEVEFIASADPETRFTGHLTRIADTARTDTRHGTTVAATVEIGDGRTRDDLIREELRRPGASVIAKIHCGRKSLGTIWTADFIHYLRTRWLF